MMVIVRLLVVAFACLVIPAVADGVRAVGYGKTEHEAEYDAVMQAVRQVTGVSVSETEIRKIAGTEEIASGEMTDSVRLSFVSKLNKEQAIQAKGRVKGWTCESIAFDETRKRYTAKVLVEVVKYAAPDGIPDDQRRIVVLPFETERGSFKIVKKSIVLETAAGKLAEKLNDYITQTRKFTVLDRRYDTAVNRELEMLKSGDFSPDELIKLGNKLATDYMLVGDMRIMDRPTNLENMTDGRRDYAMLVLHYRIILCATTQVRWSDTISVSSAAAVGATEEECIENLLDEGARRLHLAIVENIYPIKVAAFDNSDPKKVTLVLNRGGRSLKVGDRFTLYKLGDEIRDPDTGEVLDRRETSLCEIVVTEVRNKTSYATMVNQAGRVHLKADDVGKIVVRRGAFDLPAVTTASQLKTVERRGAAVRKATSKSLSEMRTDQYSRLEQHLYKIRTGNFTRGNLSALFKMQNDAPNGEMKNQIVKIVGAGLVSIDEIKSYNQVAKKIPGRSLFESKMEVDCRNCSGSGEGDVSCSECSGTGKCKNCHGSGVKTHTAFGSFHTEKYTCGRCDGRRNCVRCDGSGKVKGRCHSCMGRGKVSSAAAAEKLALSLIQGALEEFEQARKNGNPTPGL